MQIFDSHCHLDDDAYEKDRLECLTRAAAAGVAKVLNPGYDIASSRAAVDLASQYGEVYAAVGIHPQKGEEHNQESLSRLHDLASSAKVVAIGEIGLDYYWMTSPKEAQHEALMYQIALAGRLGLPVIIHTRDASQETFGLIKANRARLPGVLMHCYSGSAEMAAEYVKMGCMISLAGPVTFKNARKTHEVAAKVPLSHLMVETDGPYLAPVPHRGERNEPSYTRLVVEKIAEIRGIPVGEVARTTYDNTMRFFGIKG